MCVFRERVCGGGEGVTFLDAIKLWLAKAVVHIGVALLFFCAAVVVIAWLESRKDKK